MNVSKILGAALIVLSSCYIGFSSAAGINIELRDLRRLISALDYMSCELQYNLTPLPTLCKETAKECEGKFKHLFILLAEELENQISPDVKSCMRVAISKTKGLSNLMQKSLLQLGASMGRFDLDGQVSGLEGVRASCRSYINNLEAGKESRLRTYKTIGVCAGAALVILLI